MLKLCFILFAIFSLFTHQSNGECCTKNHIRFDVKGPLSCDDFYGASNLWTQKGFALESNSHGCGIWVCNDGRPLTDGNYCGNGPCNIFGCNCDGGCVTGKSWSPHENFKEIHGDRVQNVR